jgi:hypothetical protein
MVRPRGRASNRFGSAGPRVVGKESWLPALRFYMWISSLGSLNTVMETGRQQAALVEARWLCENIEIQSDVREMVEKSAIPVIPSTRQHTGNTRLHTECRNASLSSS